VGVGAGHPINSEGASVVSGFLSKRVCRHIVTLAIASASLCFGFAAGPASASASARGPAWLSTINYYRAATGLQPVTDNPAWDRGIEHHLTYLVKTPRRYVTGQYASAHTENPKSPYYTASGALEASYSDLALGGAGSPIQALDGWLASPFHAVGVLRAELTRVALADDPRTGYAGLDVIQGLNYLEPADPNPILYPGPGSTTDLLTFSGTELPDPLQTCRWSDSPPAGLPLIMLLPQTPSNSLSATLSGPHGTESSGNHRLCVVDAHTFYSTDRIYGPTGLTILQQGNGVFLIPRHALTTGEYSVTVKQPSQPDIKWSFSAVAPVTMTSIRSLDVQAHTVTVEIATPTSTHLKCALTRRGKHGFGRSHFSGCGTTTIYRNVRHGRYRFSVHSTAGDASRQFTVS
jgi:hypothetical protein